MRLPLPSLPGPLDVIDGAAALRDGVAAALELVPRAAAAMTRLEALLDRADQAVARTEALADSADVALARSQRTIDVAEITARDSGRAVEGAMGTLDRVDALLQQWEPALRKLAPDAQKIAESINPDEVRAAIALIDRLPQVFEHLENDVLPMLRQLDRVGPDVHELLEVVEDLRKVFTGLPGVGFLRRRADEEPPEIEGSVHS